MGSEKQVEFHMSSFKKMFLFDCKEQCLHNQNRVSMISDMLYCQSIQL